MSEIAPKILPVRPGRLAPLMLAAIVLDVLLFIILLTMIPLGFLRGGLREVCTSAGLLLGILLALNWSKRWGSAISDGVAVRDGAAQFLVAIILVVVSTALVGYGGSASFTYHPGPGGRMYGASLALLNGIVFAGFLINAVIANVYEGQLPRAVQDGYISRGLSVGFEWVLLSSFFCVLIGTVFGMLVRERSDEDPYSAGTYGRAVPESPQQTQRVPAIRPDSTSADGAEPRTAERPSAPVRVREVRHWEEQPEQSNPQRDYGSGWRQTWPEAKGKDTARPWEQSPKRSSTRRSLSSSTEENQKSPNERDIPRDGVKGRSARDES